MKRLIVPGLLMVGACASIGSTGAIKQTMQDLRTLATALEARATDYNEYPASASLDELQATLQPTYIRIMPRNDGWGTPYRYLGSPDKQQYRFVSAAGDKSFEDESLGAFSDSPTGKREASSPDEDIIFENGTFTQHPKLANE